MVDDMIFREGQLRAEPSILLRYYWTRFGTEDCVGCQGTKGRNTRDRVLPSSRWVTGMERFTSDIKDADITGAMFVCNNG
jgi:hypothetical protein